MGSDRSAWSWGLFLFWNLILDELGGRLILFLQKLVIMVLKLQLHDWG
jgi:hypothetical protein